MVVGGHSSTIDHRPSTIDHRPSTIDHPMQLAPGAHHFPRFLTLEQQRELAGRCRTLIDGAVPAYVPIVRGGGRMHVRMLCLGRHWNAKTYQYESTRTDFDGLLVPPLPSSLRALAQEIAANAGMTIEPDLCIINYYTE